MTNTRTRTLNKSGAEGQHQSDRTTYNSSRDHKCRYQRVGAATARAEEVAVSAALSERVVLVLPAVLAVAVYLNTLQAGFVYDDHRAILDNPDVTGKCRSHLYPRGVKDKAFWESEEIIEASWDSRATAESSWGRAGKEEVSWEKRGKGALLCWRQLWTHDFWGGRLNRSGSHGSWRPLTTLSFRLNTLLVLQYSKFGSTTGTEDVLNTLPLPNSAEKTQETCSAMSETFRVDGAGEGITTDTEEVYEYQNANSNIQHSIDFRNSIEFKLEDEKHLTETNRAFGSNIYSIARNAANKVCKLSNELCLGQKSVHLVQLNEEFPKIRRDADTYINVSVRGLGSMPNIQYFETENNSPPTYSDPTRTVFHSKSTSILKSNHQGDVSVGHSNHSIAIENLKTFNIHKDAVPGLLPYALLSSHFLFLGTTSGSEYLGLGSSSHPGFASMGIPISTGSTHLLGSSIRAPSTVRHAHGSHTRLRKALNPTQSSVPKLHNSDVLPSVSRPTTIKRNHNSLEKDPKQSGEQIPSSESPTVLIDPVFKGAGQGMAHADGHAFENKISSEHDSLRSTGLHLKRLLKRGAWTFHLVNVLLHGVVTYLFVVMMREVKVERLVRLVSGTMFAVHPVHCEAVASVVGRAELLAGVCFCLSVGAYARLVQQRRRAQRRGGTSGGIHTLGAVVRCSGLWWAVWWAAVGLLCKEQAVTALGVGLLLHTTHTVVTTHPQTLMLAALFWELLSPVVLTVTLLLLRHSVTVGVSLPVFARADNHVAHARSALTRALTIPNLWARHARLLVWPQELSFDWSETPLLETPWDVANMETLLLLSVLLGLFVTCCRMSIAERQNQFLMPGSHVCRLRTHHKTVDDDSWQGQEGREMKISPGPFIGHFNLTASAYCCRTRRKHRRYLSAADDATCPGSRTEQLFLGLGLLGLPFLPSSNLWLWVGFTVAERVLYLPSMGACLLMGLGLQAITKTCVEWSTPLTVPERRADSDGEKIGPAPDQQSWSLHQLPHSLFKQKLTDIFLFLYSNLRGYLSFLFILPSRSLATSSLVASPLCLSSIYPSVLHTLSSSLLPEALYVYSAPAPLQSYRPSPRTSTPSLPSSQCYHTSSPWSDPCSCKPIPSTKEITNTVTNFKGTKKNSKIKSFQGPKRSKRHGWVKRSDRKCKRDRQYSVGQQRSWSLCLLALVVLVVLLAMALRTWRRNQDWYSDETLYTTGIAFSPAKALANLGVVYSETGRPAMAEEAYRAALRLAPNRADTHYNLGMLLSAQRRLNAAFLSHSSAVALRPWFAQGQLALACTALQLGQEHVAQQALEQCTRSGDAPAKDDRSHALAVAACSMRLATLHIRERRPVLALQVLQDALQRPSTTSPAFYTLQGEALLLLGDLQRARVALQVAVSASPTHPPALLAMARLIQAEGRTGAERWLRRAVAAAPSDSHALQHLGQLLLERGRVEEATRVWVQAAALDPHHHTSAFNAATAFRLAGDYTRAEHYYRRAVQLNPRDVASHRNLGALLHLTRRLSEAMVHYQLALDLAPHDTRTLTNIERLKMLRTKIKTE